MNKLTKDVKIAISIVTVFFIGAIIIALIKFTSSGTNKKSISTKAVQTEQSKAIETKNNADAKIISDKKAAEAKAAANNSEIFVYKKYVNEKYGYSISYPDSFKIIDDPAKGDGNILQSADGKASLKIVGQNNTSAETADSEYAKIPNDIYYKAHLGNWIVTSFVQDNNIVYIDTAIGTKSTNTFIFKFPKDEKEIYTPVVEMLNKTFLYPGINQNH